MRVIAISSDGDAASARYRSELPGRALASAGVTVERNNGKAWPCYWEDAEDGWPEFRGFEEGFTVDADLIVLHRAVMPYWPEMIREFQRRGVAVVVDLDDALDAIDKGNVAYRGFSPEWHWVLNGGRGVWVRRPGVRSRLSWRNVWECAQLADLVTVSTAALVRWGMHGRVRVLPNRMPASYLELEAPDRLPDGPVVGWPGRCDTHPGDLGATRGGVGAALRVGGRFRVIGERDAGRVRRALRLDDDPEVAPWAPFEEYPSELARLDVGVVPLKPGRFNDAKSALKLMELSSVGVATVASPTMDNLRVHRDGVGLIAPDGASWHKHVARLVTDADYRACIASHSRAKMHGHTIEMHAGDWLDAWRSALDRRAATRAAVLV